MKGKLRCHSGKGEQKRLSVSNSGEGGEPSGEGRGVGQTGKARRMLCPEKAGGEDAGARRGENEGDCCMVCGADSAGLVALSKALSGVHWCVPPQPRREIQDPERERRR
eukprot:CAMPEP_0175934604 /NCGR_PEP_ID=MMETSP0108-20121206/20583_1 /TAXON_ID=195067 ORGANISM="Goniomonas pacifica, Strain CCMP1869" /NCGR_SAMPLE_ID=MMETSP0108 /ASSEMBLY_ACC=CAM_ASM_000204 /LENGTH=108 /DNA_ID=CAMNT_0017258463 /DNA_START=149 /DNA_END=475 /DNA_ORIENTATION=-